MNRAILIVGLLLAPFAGAEPAASQPFPMSSTLR